MMNEFEKINDYFDEAERLWESNPDLVLTRDFFELWEASAQANPFFLDTTTFQFPGCDITFPDEAGILAYFDWHDEEGCACLRVEGRSFDQNILIDFQDGMPVITEQPLELLEDTELSFGERLEVMYDVVAYIRRNQPGRDLHKLNRRTFLNVLKVIAPRYSTQAVAVMRGLRQPTIQKLLARALEDLPRDEWSNQLMLPLDGNYATPAPASALSPQQETQAITIRLAKRTNWHILQDLAFIQDACLALASLDETFILDLSAAEILESSSTGHVLRVPARVPPNIQVGDRLRVFMRGARGSIAMLNVDHLERDAVYGRLSWNDSFSVVDINSGKLFARPRQGPDGYLAGLVNHVVQIFRDKGTLSAPGIEAALGVHESPFEDVGAGAVMDGLDHSQARAWCNAVHEQNPVMLIQGPPGTGKTHVLEQVVRELFSRGQRILITAPSNTAIDNVCRRICDLPLLRVGNDRESVDPTIATTCWVGDLDAVQRVAKERRKSPGAIYAGTHVGILRDEVIAAEAEQHGPFDCIIFDEAGMARLDQFILCAMRARRVILFGDHQQLPPFPLPQEVIDILEQRGPVPRRQWRILQHSALEWLSEERGFPVFLLQSTYRCQNPRLMRFSSTLFYNARVKTSQSADYYQLSYQDRTRKYPPATLRIYRTSKLPLHIRQEQYIAHGHRPGLENHLEARLCVLAFGELLRRYPPEEITIIAPYRRQVRLIRDALSLPALRSLTGRSDMTETERDAFIYTRISTVDSFQGGESDAVVICYVRSNDGRGIGFVDDPQRINVAHTRCRRELIIIGDIDCLKANAGNHIFERLERAVSRDGQIIDITPELVDKLPRLR